MRPLRANPPVALREHVADHYDLRGPRPSCHRPPAPWRPQCPGALEAAIAEALANDAAHLRAVRQALDRHRHARELPPPLAVALPEDPRLRTLSVRPHPLRDYDALHPESPDEHEPQS
jgi:hypothetical protein